MLHTVTAQESDCRGVGEPEFSTATAGWRSLLYEEYVSRSLLEPVALEPLADFSFIVFLGGAADIEVRNQRFWDRATHSRGTVSLTPPGRETTLRWRTRGVEPLRTAKLFVPQTLIHQLADELGVDGGAANLPSALKLLDPTVVAAVTGIGVAAKSTDHLREEYANAAVQFLVAHLLCRLGDGRQSRSRTRFDGIRGLLRDAAFEGRSVKDVAADARLSELELQRLVRDETGYSVHAYLESLQLAEARRLLERTTLPITTIAYRCAFASPSHFAARFRLSLGVTPTSWRISNRGR